ncbi:MAG: hypothetical protein KKC29_09170 [Alphaproteobacteria bacterium]|jgi:hypothetical protein|nr:hypothetical protein [Alphaproteobacteria bacterium]MBU2040782.1 hypothetical protein [Alphaproteobacteria bacterium]MBU2207892.1 hypothetical protein [Alphaproteobacteria bacterium]MBU2291255.1 hypothetical protein [Alphaproteobacteria bacterium]MBU2396689.1 hypothetical protein [Alphaproteobacteria bacterium]
MISVLRFTAIFSVVAALFTILMFGYWAVGFVLMLVGSSYIALAGYAVGTSVARPPTMRPIYTTTTFNIVVCLIALLGLAAMFYDRTSLRGIDYANLGMAGARAEFNSAGERGGVISIFGNLFSAAIYLPLINLIFDWERWKQGRLVVVGLVVVGILGLTYVTGGRTALLIAVAMTAAAMLGRSVLGMKRLPSFLSPTSLVLGILAVAIVFGAVFALRASAFGVSSGASYVSQLCFHLAQPTTEITVRCSTIAYASGVQAIDDIVNFGMAVLLYTFHVAWVGESVFTTVNPGALTSFEGPQAMFLGRFGFEIVATDYDGYFIPAAASLVFDFGFLEMALGFVILGLFAGIFRGMMLSGKLFVGRVAFTFAVAGLMICVMISPLNLPVMLLAIMAITAIAGAAFCARLIGLIPANSVVRELRRVTGPPPEARR